MKIFLGSKTFPPSLDFSIVLLRLLSFAVLLLSLSLPACVKRPRALNSSAAKQDRAQAATGGSIASTDALQSRININTASVKELESLPGIGKGLAQRIVEYRDKYGPFGRAEHLIMVRGISEKRFRVLRDLISVD